MKRKGKSMKISIMTTNGLNGLGGGENPNLQDRVAALEKENSDIKQSRAAEGMYGLAKISGSESVTETDSGLVLGAVQNNAALPGTIANQIQELKDRSGICSAGEFVELENGFSFIGGYEYQTVAVSGNIVNLAMIVSGTFGGEERVICRLKDSIWPARNFVYKMHDDTGTQREIRACWDGTIAAPAIGEEKTAIVTLNITYARN